MFELFHLFYSLSFISLSSLEGSLLFILYSISFYWYIYVCVYFSLFFKKLLLSLLLFSYFIANL